MLPGTVNECFEFGWRAFDIAERLQTPVFVLSDLDLGMNQWMTPPFEYPEEPLDRGKVLWEEDLEKLDGKWARYLDIDGDSVPYRTVPGNRHPKAAYFSRGTGHTNEARYSEDSDVWVELLARLKEKHNTARSLMPESIIENLEGSEIGVVGYGSTEPAVREARDQLAAKGIMIDFLRIRSVPFTRDVREFIRRHRVNYVIEMNRDGQLKQLLLLDNPDISNRIVSLAYFDGLPMTARYVREAILAAEEERDE